MAPENVEKRIAGAQNHPNMNIVSGGWSIVLGRKDGGFGRESTYPNLELKHSDKEFGEQRKKTGKGDNK